MTEGTDALKTARKQLERQKRGEKALGNAHCMLKYFSPKSYHEVENARDARERAQRMRSPEERGNPTQLSHDAEEADRRPPTAVGRKSVKQDTRQ
jgi:hypothetical protein